MCSVPVIFILSFCFVFEDNYTLLLQYVIISAMKMTIVSKGKDDVAGEQT